MSEVDLLGENLDKLNKMIDAKCNLSELQSTNVQLQSEFQDLKKNMLEDIDTLPARLIKIKFKYLELIETIDPLEKLFGSFEDFECINKYGETKTIKNLLEGKTHLLL